MHGDLAELLSAAEAGGVRNAGGFELSKVHQGQSRSVQCVGDAHDSEASTIVRSVTGTGWSWSLGKTPRKLKQKNTGNTSESAT